MDNIIEKDITENEEQQEGTIIDTEDGLSIDLSDEELLSIIGNRIEDSKRWWNSELNLDGVRKKAEDYYLNKSYNEDDLYDYQVPYKNNRIIIDVESLVALAVMNPAEPTVTEANDTDASRQLALDLQNVLMALYEDLYLKAKITKVARHILMGKRVGVLKYRFNPNRGVLLKGGERKGTIEVVNVRPEKIVIAENTGAGENPLFIAEYCEDTVEALVAKFPNKKDEIYKDQGIQRGTKKQLQKVVGYLEVWLTYYDKSGVEREGVIWKLNNVILDKIKNPNWNYDEYEEDAEGNVKSLNFLEMPVKPYVWFTHLDIDKYLYDETALIDHAIPLQDILNKRGRQIVENADQATSGMVYNTEQISQEDMAKVIGDPSEKLGVQGNVSTAATRLPYNPLPQYVIGDKLDARAEIDNIFGANAPIKGESSGIETLGQEVLSQRANMGRLQPLADAIEDGMDTLYKGLVQMIKVYWDEAENVRFTQADGRTQFINFSSKKVEDGVSVRVRAGSALPTDKAFQHNETMQLAAMLDPLSIAEGLEKKNPKEFAQRLTYYRFFMDKYLPMIEGEDTGMDKQAMADIQLLLSGQQPQVPDDVTKEYVATFEQFMQSPQFKELPPEIQQLVTSYVEQLLAKAKGDMGEEPEEAKQITEGGTMPEEEQPIEEPAEDVQPQPENGNIISRGVNALRERIGL